LRALKVSRFVVLHLIRQRKDAVLYGVGAIAFTLVIIASIAVLSFEDVPQANIRSAGDALWWALCTISTVGYGDFYPVTWEGRIVAAILMTTGVGMIGVLSGTMVSWLVQPGYDREKQELRHLREEIAALTAQVAALRESSASAADKHLRREGR
jgi:voltage-gated potassium channel